MDGACLELADNVATQEQSEGDFERSLVRRAQRGDRTAFDALVCRYDQEVLRMALRIVQSHEEAQDLYQEAFLKVYRLIGRFRLESKFSTWLYRVVMNVCLDHLRRQKSRGEMQMPESEDGQPDYLSSIPEERAALHPARSYEAREIAAPTTSPGDCHPHYITGFFRFLLSALWIRRRHVGARVRRSHSRRRTTEKPILRSWRVMRESRARLRDIFARQ